VSIEAGIGTAVITPPTPVQLAGFAEDQPATEVHDDLEVRVLYLGAEHGAVALVVCDLLGLSRRFAQPVRDAVATELGVAPTAVLTSCVHTHAGPSTIEGSERIGWPTPEGYGALLLERCLAAARAARADAAPVEMRVGRWPLPAELSVNRRDLPYEPTFAVLDLLGRDGRRRGTLANIAVHPVALGPECLAVSSDWVGSFRSNLEARAGGRTVLLSGALGDVNPHHVHRQHNDCRGDGFAEAAQLGRDLADAVEDKLAGAAPVDAAAPVVDRHRFVDVELGATLLAAGRGGRTWTIELIEWSLGPVRLVSIPGEAFHALGRAVEDRVEHEGSFVIVAGLAPEWHGYLPMPYRDGYEESMSYGPAAVATVAAALTEPLRRSGERG